MSVDAPTFYMNLQIRMIMTHETMLFTSVSVPGCAPIHLEALMLALFNKLRVEWFPLAEPFSVAVAFPGPLVAPEVEVSLSKSLFFSEAASLGAGTRSLKKRFYVMNIRVYMIQRKTDQVAHFFCMLRP